MNSKRQRFRQLIEADDILIQPGIYNGFSARLAQQVGFKSAAISGVGLSETRLGWADVGLKGDEQSLHASRAIAACVDIPVSANADTGYGNAITVHFTVHSFEQAGVELQDLGVAVVGFPRLVTSAAIQGTKNALSDLLQSATEGRVIEQPDLAVSFRDTNELMGSGTIKDMEQRFLTAAQKQAKYGAAQ